MLCACNCVLQNTQGVLVASRRGTYCTGAVWHCMHCACWRICRTQTRATEGHGQNSATAEEISCSSSVQMSPVPRVMPGMKLTRLLGGWTGCPSLLDPMLGSVSQGVARPRLGRTALWVFLIYHVMCPHEEQQLAEICQSIAPSCSHNHRFVAPRHTVTPLATIPFPHWAARCPMHVQSLCPCRPVTREMRRSIRRGLLRQWCVHEGRV